MKKINVLRISFVLAVIFTFAACNKEKDAIMTKPSHRTSLSRDGSGSGTVSLGPLDTSAKKRLLVPIWIDTAKAH